LIELMLVRHLPNLLPLGPHFDTFRSSGFELQ